MARERPIDYNFVGDLKDFNTTWPLLRATLQQGRSLNVSIPVASVLHPGPAVNRSLLLQNRTLLRQLCSIYSQDFVCLGYPWPAACTKHATRDVHMRFER